MESHFVRAVRFPVKCAKEHISHIYIYKHHMHNIARPPHMPTRDADMTLIGFGAPASGLTLWSLGCQSRLPRLLRLAASPATRPRRRISRSAAVQSRSTCHFADPSTCRWFGQLRRRWRGSGPFARPRLPRVERCLEVPCLQRPNRWQDLGGVPPGRRKWVRNAERVHRPDLQAPGGRRTLQKIAGMKVEKQTGRPAKPDKRHGKWTCPANQRNRRGSRRSSRLGHTQR